MKRTTTATATTAADFVAELVRNCQPYFEGVISHEQWSANQRETWTEIEAANFDIDTRKWIINTAAAAV